MTEHTEEKTLKDVVGVVFSHYKVFLVGVSVFMIAVMIGSHYLPVKYSASSIFERRGDSAVESLSNNPNESFQTMRLTLQQELASPEAIELAIERIGVTRHWPRNEDGTLTTEGKRAKGRIVQAVTTNLSIEWKVRSEQVDQIEVRFSCDDPDLTQQIPNALVEQYIEWAGEKIVERLKDSREFLQGQILAGSKQIAELTNKKIEFESKYGLMLNGSGNFQERIQDVYSDIETLRRQQGLARQKVFQTKALIRSVRSKALRDQLNQLEKEMEALLLVHEMTLKHPKVQNLSVRIVGLQNRLRENEKTEMVISNFDQEGIDSGLVLQLLASEAEVQTIQDEIGRMQDRLASYRDVSEQVIPLREEYLTILKPLEEHQQAVARWKNRLANVEMALAAEDANRRTQLTMIKEAKRPYKPVFPSAMTLLGVALGGGLAIGYALSFMASSMDHTIRTPKQLFDDLNVPVVGVISEITTGKEKTIRQIKKAATGVVVIVLITGALGLSTLSALERLKGTDENTSWVHGARAEQAQTQIDPIDALIH